MSEQADRIAAWVIALVVNILVITYLTQAMRPAWAPEREEEHLIRLVFLDSPKQVADLPPSKPRQARQSTNLAKPPATSLHLVPQPASVGAKGLQVISIAPPLPSGDDDWGIQSPQGDTTVVTPDLKPNPLLRRPPPMQATASRMQLRMQDRSIGGVLQAMTKSAICRELRQALSASPASAVAILAAMDENGCNSR